MHYRHWINGQFVEGQGTQTFTCLNPSSQEVLGTIRLANRADVDGAVKAAREAYKGVWGQMTGKERARKLMHFADAIEHQAASLGELESKNVGKLLAECVKHDVARASQNIRFFAGSMRTRTDEVFHSEEQFLGKDIRTQSIVKRYAVGPCALIVPWNSPLMLAAWKIGPCLATGNTCVLKPSPWASLACLQLGAIAKEAGIPDGVLNIITGAEEAGDTLVRHPDVVRVSFTGSVPVGRAVNRANAEARLAPISLELGGKSPAVVFADCDFEATVAGVFRGIFRSQGQSCVAGSRLIVEESLAPHFLEALVAMAKKATIGSQLDAKTEIGPVITAQHLERVERFVNEAKNEGATVLCGGERVPNLKGNFIAPTILKVTSDMKIWKEEVFGPVLVVQTFKTEAEAYMLANDSEFGLSATVWTSNYHHAQQAAEQIESGLVWVNSHFVRDLRAPFAGIKNSGIGQEGGRYSLEFYTAPKMVCQVS